MFWRNSKNNKPNDSKGMNNVLVRQDPRTKVRTATAQSETTNTTEHSATIYDNERNKITRQTVRQTVTHQQTAGVTEFSIRRTPTKEELDELQNITGTNAGFFESSTPWTKKETIVTQTNGRTQTSFVQQQRTKFDQSGRAPTFQNFTDNSKQPASLRILPAITPPLTVTSPTLSKTARSASSSTASSSSGKSNAAHSATTTANGAYPNPFAKYSNPKSNEGVVPKAPTYIPVYGKSSITSSTTNQRHASAAENPTVTSTVTMPSALLQTQSKTSLSIGAGAGTGGKKTKLKPGHAVIFNNVDFNDKKRFEKRDGSDYDAKLIRETLQKYKLNVDTINNPTVKRIKDIVKTLTKKDYTNCSCLVIAILSHGSAHDSVAASDGEYNVDETMLLPLLEIPSLKEKPKIFIIQACKGAMVPGEYKMDAYKPRGSPSEILKCNSTFEGYVSYRTEKGSPFVQALCDEIKLKGQNMDIEQLMKNAIQTVKIQTRSNQIPCMITNLTKPFIFGDYV